MKLNMGTLDRTLRVVAGIALIGLTLTNMIGPWGWIGVLLLATGLIGVCPAYVPFGYNTCATKPAADR
jgi:hypothetical protein